MYNDLKVLYTIHRPISEFPFPMEINKRPYIKHVTTIMNETGFEEWINIKIDERTLYETNAQETTFIKTLERTPYRERIKGRMYIKAFKETPFTTHAGEKTYIQGW
jgi:hypothetical protein